MAIRQTFVLPDTVTTAGIKSWTTDIGAAFLAAGWVQTSDLNQINWSAFAAPSNNYGVTFGYEIYKSTDALSATCPIFVKIWYGTTLYTTSPNNGPMVWFAVGFASDGFGNIILGTGQMGSTAGVRPQLIPTNVRIEMAYAWSGANIAMVLFGHQTMSIEAAIFFAVERSHDANGDDTDEYITVLRYGSGAVQQISYFKPGGGVGPLITSQGSYILPDSNNSAGGTAAGVGWSPCFPQIGRVGNPMRMVGGFKSVDVGDNQIVKCQLYGVTQTYLTYRTNSALTAIMPGGVNQQVNSGQNFATLGLRWDVGA